MAPQLDGAMHALERHVNEERPVNRMHLDHGNDFIFVHVLMRRGGRERQQQNSNNCSSAFEQKQEHIIECSLVEHDCNDLEPNPQYIYQKTLDLFECTKLIRT